VLVRPLDGGGFLSRSEPCSSPGLGVNMLELDGRNEANLPYAGDSSTPARSFLFLELALEVYDDDEDELAVAGGFLGVAATMRGRELEAPCFSSSSVVLSLLRCID